MQKKKTGNQLVSLIWKSALILEEFQQPPTPHGWEACGNLQFEDLSGFSPFRGSRFGVDRHGQSNAKIILEDLGNLELFC